ncbi:diadenylate cyclase [Mycoplasma phocimorsus]|uniref:DNA integrity scanning protein DisA nucleotide-binding domain protein n=1 Tax=Mycoplasma phocimorsus TaxID=3045839 RepID=A0AAJ1PSM3_9MOLU|nr:DNA integrity scanning protein DisA nucleotide-binding domain protein [Mycoplasma phocimorsus]MDJ1646023.1 DNA integrity scanning protein DisA nucleotide-binding domain protein [Mycoplasma phocimorsus]MDJ1646304.1 DNA integrity scanning protein DisA nucleotide-binding domain protein [Mycoplasma phocimorsus]MDJ1646909.1 DNA integrity scanning protein DisA nucleotide-binding domain protein [Mycoplasma phocimorsus]MDJ1647876.1 DNA integrity scanning protein DisA nucleotide-binding domain protei
MEKNQINILIALSSTILFIILGFVVFLLISYIKEKTRLKRSKQNLILALSSKLRVINQLKEAISYLSRHKIGALITIENSDNLDMLRTDGIILDANISSSLLIAIFSKSSPLHDGAVIIRNNKIYYASTFYKITKKSIDNKYGSRHRAAIGISEVSDSLTIVVSEETGTISFIKRSQTIIVDPKDLQSKLSEMLNLN